MRAAFGLRRVGAIAAILLITASCTRGPAGTLAPGSDVVVVAAGDIVGESTSGAWEKTADLIGSINPQAVLTLGDNQYPDGSLSQFRAYYKVSWGTYINKTYPAPGNHEYETSGAAGYFDYFGIRAPAAYYSFDLGSWHFISMNSEVNHSEGSAQEKWLKADLAATKQPCILAYWHKPRWSSGTTHGSDSSLGPLVSDLWNERADLLLVGHEHNYERFAKQNARGHERGSGIREIVVGTGGKDHRGFGTPIRNSKARDDTSFGVLKLTLHPSSYDVEFVPATGTFTDSLTDVACH